MAKEKKQLSWMEVDLSAVKGNKKYDAYKAKQKEASEARAAFEEDFINQARSKKAIDDTQTLRFSYNFGKLSVAKDVKDAPKTAGGTFKL